MSDEALYKKIAAELSANQPETAIWTQAYAEALGDPDRTKALYIRLRLASLKKMTGSSAMRVTLPSETALEAQPNPALVLLRSALAKALGERGATSFYSTLGITPEADDASVARAIAVLESRIDAGTAAASPEFRYAKETLGNAKAREAYDRRLAEKFSNAGLSEGYGVVGASSLPQSDSVLMEWWNSRRTAVVVGAVVIAIVGYMLLGFYKERSSEEVQRTAIDAMRSASQTKAENERIANDRAAELRERAAEIAEREAIRRQQEADNRAFERSRQLDIQRERENKRAADEEERQKLATQREEERRAEKLRRYWSCMNQALNRMNTSDAEARCGSLRS